LLLLPARNHPALLWQLQPLLCSQRFIVECFGWFLSLCQTSGRYFCCSYGQTKVGQDLDVTQVLVTRQRNVDGSWRFWQSPSSPTPRSQSHVRFQQQPQVRIQLQPQMLMTAVTAIFVFRLGINVSI